MYENDMNEQRLFQLVFEHLQNKFTHLNLEMVNPHGPNRTIVSMNGEIQFNTDGQDLFHNLKSLCSILDNELQ